MDLQVDELTYFETVSQTEWATCNTKFSSHRMSIIYQRKLLKILPEDTRKRNVFQPKWICALRTMKAQLPERKFNEIFDTVWILRLLNILDSRFAIFKTDMKDWAPKTSVPS